MIDIFKRADVEAVKDDLALQLIPVLFDMVMLHHNHHHIDIIQERIKIRELVLCDLMILQEGVIALQRTGQMTLLGL